MTHPLESLSKHFLERLMALGFNFVNIDNRVGSSFLSHLLAIIDHDRIQWERCDD